MTRSVKFWNWMAARYARTPVADEAAYQQKLDKTKTYLHPDTKLLEFGCGTGSTALVHAPHVKSVLATDYSKNMIAIAREKLAASDLCNVSFETMTIEDIAEPDESYDVVLGMSILHLLPNKRAAIDKSFRLLKPGGVFVSSTACIGEMIPILKWILPVVSALRIVPYIGVFRSDDLVQDIEAAGFEIDHQWQPAPDKALFIVAKKPS